MDEYVSPETYDWCKQQLHDLGIELETIDGGSTISPSSGEKAHVQAYQCLRDLVRRHLISGELPLLSELLKPHGRYDAIRAHGGMMADLLEANAEFVRRDGNAEYMRGMEEQLVREQDEFDDGEED